MIPSKTHDKIGPGQVAACATRDAHELYVLTGTDLNDLACLAVRFNFRMEGDELRDWQNRVSLMVSGAVRLSEQEER